MENEKFNLLFTLLRLKSYLISLIDDPDNCGDTFQFTEEYLSRIYPEKSTEIINILKENGINTDCDIVFNEKIHLKFQKISNQENPTLSLETLLNNFDIESKGKNVKDIELNRLRIKKDQQLESVLKNLFYLAKAWREHRNIEDRVDDYSLLEDQDVLREEEETKLDHLSETVVHSFNNITKITKDYIYLLINYYFNYGGNITLEEFLSNLDDLKIGVTKKYSDLFKRHGLDSNLNESEDR